MRAIRFLKGYGVETGSVIELRIQDDFDGKAAGLSVAGRYDFKTRSAYLAPFSDLKERGTPFDLPVNDILYQSIATHEIAHAIIAENFAISSPSVKAREYLAYVTMFATMPVASRQQLFEKEPATAFGSETDINTFLYLFDPIRFGQRAYKHFSKLSDPSAFIRRILAGQALAADDVIY